MLKHVCALSTLWFLTSGGSQASRPAVAAEYNLTVRLEPAAGRLQVSGTVQLPALPIPRDSVRLLLWSRMRGVRFELASPATPASVSTDSVDGDQSWILRPDAPIPAGTPVIIRFGYHADSVSAPQISVRPQGSYAGGGGEIWYPRPGFDSLGTGFLRFEVPPGDLVIATGRPAEGTTEPTGRFVFRVDQAAHFGFAAGRYQVVRHPGPVPVSVYLLRPRPDAAVIAANASRTLEALRGLFGALPVEEYAIAEVEFGGAVAGTSEFGFFLADGSRLDAGFSVPYFGHEIGHAWFGNLVRSRPGTVGRMMMSEGFAQYGMLQVLERIEGPEAAERFRRGTYPGHELSGAPTEYFRLAAAGLEEPLTAREPRGAQVLRVHRMANTRGFFLLDMLAAIVGRERFHELLRAFVREHQSRPASWPEFEAAASKAAGRDLRWFFDDWFVRAGAPTYELIWSRAGRTVQGEVRQGDSTFGAVLEIEARGAGRNAVRYVTVRGRTSPFAWTLPFEADTVVLDPHYRVLRWTEAIKTRAAALAEFTRADWNRRFGDRQRAIEEFQSALRSTVVPDPYGVEFLVRLGLARALAARGEAGPARAQLDTALRAAVRPAEILPFAYLEVGRLAQRAGDTVSLRWAVSAVESMEAAGGVRTGALGQVRALLRTAP